MKGGGRRKTLSSDLPPPSDPFRNQIVDDVNDQLHQQPTKDDGENDYVEEEIEDYDEQSGGQADEGENNGDEERPKLAEGFYEIEALRKKRIRKGVKQYLIKWRGWPESANTWEPVESVAPFPEMIKEFESKNSGKRKRKRKSMVGSMSQLKKKQQVSSLVTEINEDLTEPSNGSDKDPKLSQDKATSPVNQDKTTELTVHIQEDAAEPANGASKVVGKEVLRSSPRIGAKRRKSFAAKRFKKDLTKKTTATSDRVVENGNGNADDVAIGLDSENVHDAHPIDYVVTRIIKPVHYSVTVVNDIEDVHVSFLVVRSDGEEIVIDNNYLKENNPILLINFYEQHLRYSSQSE